MPDIVIFNWNVANAILYRPKHLVVPALPVQVALRDDPALQAAVAADPLLQQRMADLCKTEFLHAATVIDRQFAASDAKAAGKGALDLQRLQRELEEVTRLSVKAVADTASRKLVGMWEQLGKDRSAYRKYQIKSGIKITLGASGAVLGGLGVVGSIVGTVASGGGAAPGLAIALVAAFRSICDLGKTWRDLENSAEDVGESVDASIKLLRQAYGNAPAKPAMFGAVAAREVGVSVLNVLMPVAEAPNIPKVKSDCGLWKSKLQGLRTTAHDLAIKLNEFLVQSEKAGQYLASAPRTPQNAARITAASAKLDSLELKVRGMLDKTPAAHRRAEDGLRAQTEAVNGLNALATRAPGWTAYFDRFFRITVNLGLAGVGAGVGALEAKSALDVAQTAIGVVNDVASVLAEEVG